MYEIAGSSCLERGVVREGLGNAGVLRAEPPGGPRGLGQGTA